MKVRLIKWKFYVEKLNTILESSVKYRLNSDREVASLLSGGLDSSIVSSLITSLVIIILKHLVLGIWAKDTMNLNTKGEVAKNYSMNHKIIKSNSEEYFNDMEKLVDKGQPLSIPNEVSQYRLCKDIKKHATVVLSGTGADELFMDMEEYLVLSMIIKIKVKKLFWKHQRI